MDKHSTESLLKQRQYGREEFLLHLYLFKPAYSYHARYDRQVLCMSTISQKFDVCPWGGYNHLDIYAAFLWGAREAKCNSGAREGCQATAMVALDCLF